MKASLTITRRNLNQQEAELFQRNHTTSFT